MEIRPFLIALAVAVIMLRASAGFADSTGDLIQPNRSFILSEQESQFIQSLPPLKVMVDENFMPLSYYNVKTGAFEGISVDLYRHIAERLGLKHQFLRDPTLTWKDKVELLKNRKIDLLMSASFTAERAQYGVFTSSFYKSFYGAIALKSRNIVLSDSYDLANFKVGVTKSTAIIPFITTFVPAQQIIYYDNPIDLYHGIRSGQVDIALRNKYVFQEERFNKELFDLDLVHTLVESPSKYCYFFVKSEANQRLVEIIDRYLAGVNYGKLIAHYEKGEDELVIRYINQKQQQKQLRLATAVVVAMLVMVGFAYLNHRRASRKLEALNAHLYNQAKLLNLTHDSIIVRTMDNVITFWNDGAAKRYGWKAEDVVEKATTHDLLQTIFPIPLDEIKDILLHNDLWEGELTHTTRDGATIIVASRWSLQRNSDNEPVAIMEINNDISDRIRFEKELLLREQDLSNSERFLKAVIDTEPDCIKILDIDGNVLMMNRAGLEMIDADSVNQVKGECIYPLVTPPYRDAFMLLTQQVFKGIPGTLEFEAIGLKERHVWLETHAVPFRNEQGIIVFLLGVTRDITARKQMEAEREEALTRVKKLEGIIPICMHCKKIRDDQNSWNQLEQYISKHSEAVFSHGICPQCAESLYNFTPKKS